MSDGALDLVRVRSETMFDLTMRFDLATVQRVGVRHKDIGNALELGDKQADFVGKLVQNDVGMDVV